MGKKIFKNHNTLKFTRHVAIFLIVFILSGILSSCSKDTGGKQSDATGATSKQSAAATTSKATSATAKSTITQTSAASPSGQNAKTDAEPAGEPAEQVAQLTETGTSEEEDATAIDYSELGMRKSIADIEMSLNTGFVDPGTDLKGRTIVVGLWGYDGILSDDPQAKPEDAYRYLRLKEAEKKYNFKTEFNAGTDSTKYSEEIYTKTMAGVKFADIIKTQALFSIPIHVSNNIIVPLDDYIDYESPLIKANSYMYYGSYWKGKHYGITELFEIMGPGVMFNKDLLSREGQPDILDLVETKQWNWNSFLEIAMNCTKDTDGDGLVDQYGVVSIKGFHRSLLQYLLYSNGLGTGIDIIDGKPTYSFTLPAGQRALQFYSELCNYYKVYAVENGSASNYYTRGKAAMYVDGAFYHSSILNTGMNSAIAPLPMGPDVNDYQVVNTTNFYAVLSTCETPKEVAQIWMEISLSWDENLNPQEKLEELRSKYPADWYWSTANPNRRHNSEREYILHYKNNIKNFVTDWGLGYPATEFRHQILTSQILDPLYRGTKSVQQVVDATKSAVQAIIDLYE